MPEAKLPTTPRGWVIALAASMVGFISGLYSLKLLTGWFGG